MTNIIQGAQKKCLLLMDGSIFFRGMLAIFNALIRFFEGSFVVRLFTSDFDEERLRNSYFVRITESTLNVFPKFRMSSKLTLPGILGESALLRFFTDAMGFSLPAWGLLAVVAGAPFLPTMTLAAMVIVVFAFTLFRYNFKLDLTATALIIFIAVNILMGLGSLAPASSVPIAILISVIMLSYILIRTCFHTRKRLNFVMVVCITVAAITALVAFYQIFIGYVNMTWVDRNLFAALRLRVYSTFGNPNVYGAYLLLAIPLSAGLILYVKKPLYKLYAAGVTGMLIVALALTYSRGCYLALAGAVLVFFLLIEKRLIVFYALGLLAMPFILPAGMLARIVSIVNFADTSTAFRLAIWQASLRILGDFWMAGLGQGIDAYNRVYPFYSFAAVPSPHAHNLFLQIFLETGIIGLLVWMAVLACFFRTQFSFMRHTTDVRRKILSAAITAGVIGFLMQGMFDHVFYNYRVMLVFFLFLGIGNSLTTVEDDS